MTVHLIFNFLSTNKNSCATVQVTGKRRQEVRLVLPCKYLCMVKILDEQKQEYTGLELKHHNKWIFKNFHCVFNVNQKI